MASGPTTAAEVTRAPAVSCVVSLTRRSSGLAYQSNSFLHIDSSRAYTNIVSICNNNGRSDLADYINTYWLDENGSNTLVDHEWAKHGTCISTLNPSCYSGYKKYDDLFSFLDTTIDLHQNYDIYGALT